MKNTLACALVLALATALVADEGRFQERAVKRGTLSAVVQATGTIEPAEVIDVGAQVAGKVIKFGPDPGNKDRTIDYGTVVQEGTVLAQLDPAPYEAEVTRARTAVQRAEAALRLAKAQAILTERELRRVKKRVEDKAGDALDLDVAQAALDVARAKVPGDEAAVAQAQAALKHAEMNLGYTTIRSPVAGVILDRRVNVGQTVTAALTAPSLFLIARDLKKLQVWVSVNEADIGQVKSGQSARFTVDTSPNETFTGRVSQIRLNAVMKQNMVVYTVVIDVDAAAQLLPYLTAKVAITVGERKNVLLVPTAALRWRPEVSQVAETDRVAFLKSRNSKEPVVWVAGKGGVRLVPIKTGQTDGTWTEIVEGDLKEGTRVVTGDGKR
jgi:HlyD family secretion protein